jgi:predicted nuclease of restriction endonuclease-like (RecB) superfamily
MSPKKKPITKTSAKNPLLFDRICGIVHSAQDQAARSVNTLQVVSNWLIGREIVEEQQNGFERASYGTKLIEQLSHQLTTAMGRGFSVDNLEYFRAFYLAYPNFLESGITHSARRKLEDKNSKNVGNSTITTSIPYAARRKSPVTSKDVEPVPSISQATQLLASVNKDSWQPGRIHPNLSWTHYRLMLRVESPEARSFYEIETIDNSWSVRELERQIHSLLFERLAKSRDKKGLMELATKGQEISTALDVFKDPVVIEFLGLPESEKLVESDLERALLNHLQSFLLELGKGFAFVARQQRLTIDGDHFYIDLVFYHILLKCYVVIDLKLGKLTHQDLGQLQLYVNYYDQERRTQGDQPTLGLILCTDKNDSMVKYTLGADQSKKLFASRYKLYVPSEEELLTRIQSEMKYLAPSSPRKASRKRKP